MSHHPPDPAATASKGRRVPLPVLGQPPVEALRQEVAAGLVYAHYRANANSSRTLGAEAGVDALADLLVERGILTREEVAARRRAEEERLAASYQSAGLGVIRIETDVDKYAVGPGAVVDCDSRIHLCRAACCRLHFALTQQDVEEGIVKWQFGVPYIIRQKEDGYCVHLDDGTCGCGIYHARPIPCRVYDCRADDRIWTDFEARVPSPKLATLLGKAPVGFADESSYSVPEG